jgi:hypothetical protein
MSCRNSASRVRGTAFAVLASLALMTLQGSEVPATEYGPAGRTAAQAVRSGGSNHKGYLDRSDWSAPRK